VSLILQFEASRAVTLIAGRSGSGKSTFAIRYLLNAPGMACRFVFDPRGEFSQRLRVRPATTARELEDALAGQWVIFDPTRCFHSDVPKAFRFFCQWAFAVSGRGRGQKVMLVDEVWKYCSPQSIPLELAVCVQEGRKVGLDLMFCTQRPNQLNESITNETTEAVCFALGGFNALKTMEGLDVPLEISSHLPNGQFFAVNRDTGNTLSGRVF
jgi:hypothetical protein